MGECPQWPAEGISRIPHWLYPDPEIHAREQARIVGGPNWSYVALEAEIPQPVDYNCSCNAIVT
ncbi:MAG: hypothetical protein EXR27_20160 [Betaproteobacteria bacterium]|nr:hypothetical protein [Betaproteobacteria bacterium]